MPINNEHQEIEVQKYSRKGLIIRAIFFVIALTVAIVSFARAINSCSEKKPGYYRIELKEDEEAPFYGAGVKLEYYLDGDSSEIKIALKNLKNIYSLALKQAYILVDAENTYEVYKNLALVNQNIGQEVEIHPLLYPLLKEAHELTLLRENYNLFANILIDRWEGILLADDDERDPLISSEEATFLEEIASYVDDLTNFSLLFNDENKSVTFNTSLAFKNFYESEGLDCAILDFNSLNEAFKIKLLCNNLKEQGYTKGFVETADGLVINLGTDSTCFYAISNKLDSQTYESPVMSVSSEKYKLLSRSRVYSVKQEDYYRIINHEGKNYYRHLKIDVKSGKINNVINTVNLFASDFDIVKLQFFNLTIYGFDTIEAINNQVKKIEDENPQLSLAYTLQGDDKDVYIYKGEFTVLEDSGYNLKCLPAD